MQIRNSLLISYCIISMVRVVSAQDSVDTRSRDSRQEPVRILYMGNSLSYANLGVWSHVSKLAASAVPPISVQELAVRKPNATLYLHWLQGAALKEIRSGAYDVVVMQEDLPETTVEEFKEYCSKFVAEIRKTKARTVLFMAWDYQQLPWIDMDGIAKAHYEIAEELGIEVSPVGLAWHASMKERPDITVYGGDGQHPSNAGSYLSACTLFATIFHKSPIGLPYIDYVQRETAEYLQKIAWQTVESQTR
jgi:hypothetical protein